MLIHFDDVDDVTMSTKSIVDVVIVTKECNSTQAARGFVQCICTADATPMQALQSSSRQLQPMAIRLDHQLQIIAAR